MIGIKNKTVKELRQMARMRGLRGYSSLNRAQLVKLLKPARQRSMLERNKSLQSVRAECLASDDEYRTNLAALYDVPTVGRSKYAICGDITSEVDRETHYSPRRYSVKPMTEDVDKLLRSCEARDAQGVRDLARKYNIPHSPRKSKSEICEEIAREEEFRVETPIIRQAVEDIREKCKRLTTEELKRLAIAEGLSVARKSHWDLCHDLENLYVKQLDDPRDIFKYRLSSSRPASPTRRVASSKRKLSPLEIQEQRDVDALATQCAKMSVEQVKELAAVNDVPYNADRDVLCRQIVDEYKAKRALTSPQHKTPFMDFYSMPMIDLKRYAGYYGVDTRGMTKRELAHEIADEYLRQEESRLPTQALAAASPIRVKTPLEEFTSMPKVELQRLARLYGIPVSGMTKMELAEELLEMQYRDPYAVASPVVRTAFTGGAEEYMEFTFPQLKTFAKHAGIPVSGRSKRDLAADIAMVYGHEMPVIERAAAAGRKRRATSYDDYMKLSVKELKTIAKNFRIPVSGKNKSDLAKEIVEKVGRLKPSYSKASAEHESYMKMTLKELKSIAKKLGIHVSGKNKNDIVDEISETFHREVPSHAVVGLPQMYDDYMKLSVKELKALAKNLGIPVSGKSKSELAVEITDIFGRRQPGDVGNYDDNMKMTLKELKAIAKDLHIHVSGKTKSDLAEEIADMFERPLPQMDAYDEYMSLSLGELKSIARLLAIPISGRTKADLASEIAETYARDPFAKRTVKSELESMLELSEEELMEQAENFGIDTRFKTKYALAREVLGAMQYYTRPLAASGRRRLGRFVRMGGYLDDKSTSELREIAKAHGIFPYKMTRDELIDTVYSLLQDEQPMERLCGKRPMKDVRAYAKRIKLDTKGKSKTQLCKEINFLTTISGDLGSNAVRRGDYCISKLPLATLKKVAKIYGIDPSLNTRHELCDAIFKAKQLDVDYSCMNRELEELIEELENAGIHYAGQSKATICDLLKYGSDIYEKDVLSVREVLALADDLLVDYTDTQPLMTLIRKIEQKLQEFELPYEDVKGKWSKVQLETIASNMNLQHDEFTTKEQLFYMILTKIMVAKFQNLLPVSVLRSDASDASIDRAARSLGLSIAGLTRDESIDKINIEMNKWTPHIYRKSMMTAAGKKKPPLVQQQPSSGGGGGYVVQPSAPPLTEIEREPLSVIIPPPPAATQQQQSPSYPEEFLHLSPLASPRAIPSAPSLLSTTRREEEEEPAIMRQAEEPVITEYQPSQSAVDLMRQEALRGRLTGDEYMWLAYNYPRQVVVDDFAQTVRNLSESQIFDERRNMPDEYTPQQIKEYFRFLKLDYDAYASDRDRIPVMERAIDAQIEPELRSYYESVVAADQYNRFLFDSKRCARDLSNEKLRGIAKSLNIDAGDLKTFAARQRLCDEIHRLLSKSGLFVCMDKDGKILTTKNPEKHMDAVCYKCSDDCDTRTKDCLSVCSSFFPYKMSYSRQQFPIRVPYFENVDDNYKVELWHDIVRKILRPQGVENTYNFVQLGRDLEDVLDERLKAHGLYDLVASATSPEAKLNLLHTFLDNVDMANGYFETYDMNIFEYLLTSLNAVDVDEADARQLYAMVALWAEAIMKQMREMNVELENMESRGESNDAMKDYLKREAILKFKEIAIRFRNAKLLFGGDRARYNKFITDLNEQFRLNSFIVGLPLSRKFVETPAQPGPLRVIGKEKVEEARRLGERLESEIQEREQVSGVLQRESEKIAARERQLIERERVASEGPSSRHPPILSSGVASRENVRMLREKLEALQRANRAKIEAAKRGSMKISQLMG